MNLLRRLEHRLLIAPRGSRARPQQIDHAEAEAIAAWVAGSSRGARILVADDAVECDYRPPGMVFGAAAE